MSSVLFTLITLLSWRMMTAPAPHGPPTEAEDMFCADDFGNKGTPKLEDTLLFRYPTYLGRQQYSRYLLRLTARHCGCCWEVVSGTNALAKSVVALVGTDLGPGRETKDSTFHPGVIRLSGVN